VEDKSTDLSNPANPDSWGYISSYNGNLLDAELDKFWFPSQAEMMQSLGAAVEREIIWMGQFDDLLIGTSSFPIKLRTVYGEQLGSFDGASEITDEEDIADFVQWLSSFGGFGK
jgi:hypothetical protein